VFKPKIADEIVRAEKPDAKLINWTVNNFLRSRSACTYRYIADSPPNGYWDEEKSCWRAGRKTNVAVIPLANAPNSAHRPHPGGCGR
jgi:hypothetical protein